MRLAAHALFYLFPLATLAGGLLGGAWCWLSPAIAGLLVPLLDVLLGQDRANPDAVAEARLAGQRRWRLLLWPFVPLQLAILTWACGWAAAAPRAPHEWVAMVLAVGVVNGGLAINVAHELCHRHERLERALAQALWFSVGYMHFHVEHRLGHHARVATPLDPATARLGESVYAFWPRSILGGWRSAWALERTRLAALGRSPLQNRLIWYAALPVAFALALGAAWGPAAAAFYVLQALAAVLVLETVNYVEHYGLERQLVAPGEYERVGPAHSWNAHPRLTNWLLLALQRHSDHHANPGRRYQVLRAFDDVPELPAGYGAMVPLALLPPLWRRVMDPRALAYRKPPTAAPSTGCVGSASTLASNAS